MLLRIAAEAPKIAMISRKKRYLATDTVRHTARKNLLHIRAATGRFVGHTHTVELECIHTEVVHKDRPCSTPTTVVVLFSATHKSVLHGYTTASGLGGAWGGGCSIHPTDPSLCAKCSTALPNGSTHSHQALTHFPKHELSNVWQFTVQAFELRHFQS
jgi:hypothetical protein